jgi:dihydrofolate reductase
MARLVYSAITSLDGYVEDEHGKFDWAAPDAEVLAAVNELERPIATFLYGRRMYETMFFWETVDVDGLDPGSREWTHIWRAGEKIVFSRTLQKVRSERTQLVREFDAEAIRQLKAHSTTDLSVGGAELAGQMMAAGLVDECRLFLNPVIVGGGKRALPDGVQAQLELAEERRFRGGAVLLRYHVRNPQPSWRP